MFSVAGCKLALRSMAAPPVKLATAKGSGMHQKKMSNPETKDGSGENEGKNEKGAMQKYKPMKRTTSKWNLI